MKVTMCASKQTGHAVGQSPALFPPDVEIEFDFFPPRPDLRNSHVGFVVRDVDGKGRKVPVFSPETLYLERDELRRTLLAMLESVLESV